MGKRFSVPKWRKPALQAAAMSVGAYVDAIGLVGIDFCAQDGSTFAHGHFDLATANIFRAKLDEAIADARRKAAN